MAEEDTGIHISDNISADVDGADDDEVHSLYQKDSPPVMIFFGIQVNLSSSLLYIVKFLVVGTALWTVYCSLYGKSPPH